MKKFVNYFLQGLLIIAPLGLTIFILYNILKFMDGLLQPYIQKIFHFNIPGVGVVAIILLLALLGFIGQTIIARPVKLTLGRLLDRVPFLKLLNSAFKDIFTGFVGKEGKFNQPVLVRVNAVSDLEKIGFLTQEDVSNLGVGGAKVAVYFPHSYNWSGELFIVPSKDVRKIDGPPAEVMKFIVSGGVASFNYKNSNYEKLD
ncbi:MAG: DUF502 domain-containing protein [Bacteroidales bacterium]|nr:DUF502 domain-containing protein [Bacteroidales bacterium]